MIKYAIIVLCSSFLLFGCNSIPYDNVEFSAGIEIPLPIMPIDVGVKFKLREKLGVPNEEAIFNSLVGHGLLDDWMQNVKQRERSNNGREGSSGHSSGQSETSGREDRSTDREDN